MPKRFDYYDPSTTAFYEKMGDVRHEKSQAASEDEARSIIEKQISIDPIVEKIMGKENTDQIRAYLDDPEIKDLEFTLLSGEMTIDEMFEYAFLVPQIQHIFELIDQVSVDIGMHIRENSWKYALHNKIYNKDKFDARKISAFYESFISTYLRGMHIPEGRHIQVSLLNYLTKCLYREIGGFVLEDLEKMPGGVERVVQDYMKRGALNDANPDKEALHITYQFIFKKSTLRVALKEKLATQEEVSEVKLNELFQRVNEMSVQQNITYSETTDGVTIKINPFDTSNLKDYFLRRPIFLCLGTVSIDIPQEGVKETAFCMYRFTGELVEEGNVRMAEFIGEKQANSLKLLILKALDNYLQSVKPQLETVAVLEELEIASPQTFQYEQQEASVEEVADTPNAPEQKAKKISLSDLRGIQGSRIRRGLIKLLGEPLRVTGSHHVFRCRDGKTYPISLHDSETVGTGLLGKCLRKFGIAPDELKTLTA